MYFSFSRNMVVSKLPPIFYPWRCIILLTLNHLVVSFSTYSLSSYLPHYVKTLTKNDSTVGVDVGIAFTIFYTALCIGSGVVGTFLRYHSAKSCLIVFQFGLGVSLFLFGLSTNIIWCYVAIGFVGGFIGITVCIKVLMQSICADENEDSIVSWVYGGPLLIGVAFGPSLAGILALPAVQYPSVFDEHGVWARYPLLLVNLFLGALATMLSFITYFLLPDDIPAYIRYEGIEHDKMSQRGVYLSVDDTELVDENGSRSQPLKATLYDCFINNFLSNPSALASVALNSLYLGLMDAYQVLIALWLETNKDLGGRDYSAKDVSAVMAVSGCILIILNYTMLNKLYSCMRLKSLFSLTILISIPIICFLPMLSRINNNKVFFVACCLLQSIMVVIFTIWSAIIQIFTQKAVQVAALPLIFVLANLIGYGGSAILIPFISSIFAKSLRKVEDVSYLLVDYHLAFYVTALLTLLSCIPLVFIRDEEVTNGS